MLLAACGSQQQKSQPMTLTVSIEPLRYFTEIIAGDKFQVISMVPEGSNPETYDPYPTTTGHFKQKLCLPAYRLHWIRTSLG